jgi:aminocarboxymuconate-semialdehyde decarboxylase
MLRIAPAGMQMQKRMSGIPVLVDVDLRFWMMDRHESYVQVLTIANPIEVIAGPGESPDLGRLANDEMAALVARHPDRFPGFVAALPINAPDAALREIDRVIDELGATGVQVFTNVNGRPLDRPEHLAVLERMGARRLPVWMHPARPATVADYAGEQARSTISGGPSAGRMRPAWRWGGSCSRGSSIATPSSPSSLTTWA